MDDSEHVDCFSRNAKYAPVISIEQVTATGFQNFVLRNERAPFRERLQGYDLLFESPDEFVGFFGTVVGDEIPGFFDVSFRRARNSNAKPCEHV